MNVFLAQNMAETVMDNFNLRIPFVIIPGIPMLGFCQFPEEGANAELIGLQESFVELNNPAIVMDCIIHEISHGLAKTSGHGEAWEKSYLKNGGIGIDAANTLTILPDGWSNICVRCGFMNFNDVWESIQTRILGCLQCNEDLRPELWVKFTSGRLCGLSNNSSNLERLTTTGRNLLKLAQQLP